MSTQMVLLQGVVKIHNYNNGLVGIELPCAELTEEDRQTLHRLFPNTVDQAFELLSKELLLNALHKGSLPESPRHDEINCVPPYSRAGKKLRDVPPPATTWEKEEESY